MTCWQSDGFILLQRSLFRLLLRWSCVFPAQKIIWSAAICRFLSMSMIGLLVKKDYGDQFRVNKASNGEMNGRDFLYNALPVHVLQITSLPSYSIVSTKVHDTQVDWRDPPQKTRQPERQPFVDNICRVRTIRQMFRNMVYCDYTVPRVLKTEVFSSAVKLLTACSEQDNIMFNLTFFISSRFTFG